jgi:CRISPR-associated protein Csb2
MQFVLGGLMLPPVTEWITVTERFRGRAVRELCGVVSGGLNVHYGALTNEQRAEISLMAGKDFTGRPLKGHSHAYFLIHPDEHGNPCRLVVWRRSVPFNKLEVEALHRAAKKPVPWSGGVIYPVPLPLGTPLHRNLTGPAQRWSSVTPYVPPRSRHRFRAGKVRPGESAERLAERLLTDLYFPVTRRVSTRLAEPARLHRSRRARLLSAAENPAIGLAYHLEIDFVEPAEGPILVGDSSHFGLGLLCAVEDTP